MTNRATSYAAKLGWNDRILKVFLEMGKYDGHLYAVPKTYETLGLFYNKTLFEKNGWIAPATLEELEAVSDKMLAAGIVPFASGNANWRPANEHYVSIVLNSIAMGLLAATLLLVARRGSMFFQVVYFLPMVIATAILARVWQAMIFSPVSGINGMLQRMGFPTVDPLSQTSTALLGIATVDLWHWWGFLCVIFFAALRQVPQEQIEAARIEGAGFRQLMRHVLLPGIRPTITLMMIMTVIWSFLVFDFVYILTQGGPAFSSEVLSTFAYRSAFYDLAVGKAAAVAVVISFFGLLATAFYIRLQAREYSQ